jgi:hypothetical protein
MPDYLHLGDEAAGCSFVNEGRLTMIASAKADSQDRPTKPSRRSLGDAATKTSKSVFILLRSSIGSHGYFFNFSGSRASTSGSTSIPLGLA